MREFVLSVPWAAWLVLTPLLALIATLIVRRAATTIVFLTMVGGLGLVSALGYCLSQSGAQEHVVGSWQAPLGISLYADGLSLWMLAATALVGLAVSVYARACLTGTQSEFFWPLWLLLYLGLNALFLSGDLFNLYVALEVVGLSAATLAAQKGSPEALAGAMRYMIAALLGSLLYLLGIAFLYHAYGTLSIDLLAARATTAPVTQVAFALIAVGLILKTALFPLHFWLPAAHSSAAAPVSALLSALVIKASFYLLVRLWLDVFAPLVPGAGAVLAACGAAAVVWGSLQALRQKRIKLLVAYSTVAQLGYLFLAFPLLHTQAWQGVLYLALAHALAKAAMFLAAGNMAHFSGHDTIAELDNLAQRLPVSVAAFAIAGVSLMGLPPSAGFIGKWLFLQGALGQQMWALAAVMIGGGVFTAAYVFKVLGSTFTPAEHRQAEAKPVAQSMEWSAMLLACAAIAMGFSAMPLLELLDVGQPLLIEGLSP